MKKFNSAKLFLPLLFGIIAVFSCTVNVELPPPPPETPQSGASSGVSSSSLPEGSSSSVFGSSSSLAAGSSSSVNSSSSVLGGGSSSSSSSSSSSESSNGNYLGNLATDQVKIRNDLQSLINTLQNGVCIDISFDYGQPGGWRPQAFYLRCYYGVSSITISDQPCSGGGQISCDIPDNGGLIVLKNICFIKTDNYNDCEIAHH